MVTSKENFDQQNDSTTKKRFHKEKKSSQNLYASVRNDKVLHMRLTFQIKLSSFKT